MAKQTQKAKQARPKKSTKQDMITAHISHVHGHASTLELEHRLRLKQFEAHSTDRLIDNLVVQLADARAARKDVQAEIDGYMEILRRRPAIEQTNQEPV